MGPRSHQLPILHFSPNRLGSDNSYTSGTGLRQRRGEAADGIPTDLRAFLMQGLLSSLGLAKPWPSFLSLL